MGRTLASAEEFGRLADWTIVEIDEKERGPLRDGQPREGSRDGGPVIRGTPGIHVTTDRDLSDLELNLTAFVSFQSPEVIRELVPGDPAQPRHAVRPTVERMSLGDRRHEGLLRQLLGKVSIAAAPADQVRKTRGSVRS